jgi:BarA-like signal transduction histidine kinase
LLLLPLYYCHNPDEESKPPPTGASPTSELSAEVLARIERNKKAAQDRLKSLSTAAPPTSELSANPSLSTAAPPTSELSANPSLSTAAPPTSELSAEVLARIERNRKAAQDRLKAKNRLNGPIVTAVLQPLTPLTDEEIRKAELKRKTQAETEKAARFFGHQDKKSRNALLPTPLTPVEEIENEVPMSTQQIQYHFKVLGRGIKQEPI